MDSFELVCPKCGKPIIKVRSKDQRRPFVADCPSHHEEAAEPIQRWVFEHQRDIREQDERESKTALASGQ